MLSQNVLLFTFFGYIFFGRSRLRLDVTFFLRQFTVCTALFLCFFFVLSIVPTKYRRLKQNILWLSSEQMHAPMISTEKKSLIRILVFVIYTISSRKIQHKRYHAQFISWLTYKFLGKCHKSLYDLTVSKSAWNEVEPHTHTHAQKHLCSNRRAERQELGDFAGSRVWERGG